MEFVTQKHDNSVVAFSESDMGDSSECDMVTNQKEEVNRVDETKPEENSKSTKAHPDYLCSSEEEDLLFPVGRNRKRPVVNDSLVEGWDLS